MKEELILFETAKLAKEKGFGKNTYSFYLECKEKAKLFEHKRYQNYNDYDYVKTWRNSPYDDITSAPTQSLLQKWLREKHHLHIMIDFITSAHDIKWLYEITLCMNANSQSNNDIEDIHIMNEGFDSYEEALEKGLEKTLNLINNTKKGL